MAGNLFACAMLAMVVATLSLLKVAGRRPTRRQILVGILVTLFSCIWLRSMTPFHGCRRGDTVAPELLGGMLAGFVVATVPRFRAILPAVAALLVVGFALSLWGMNLIHESPYVGNPAYPDVLNEISRAKLNAERDFLRAHSAEHAALELPQGWLGEVWPKATGEQISRGRLGYCSGRIDHFWHSWFTGIYRLEERGNDIWCRGGRLAECVETLEIRDRPW